MRLRWALLGGLLLGAALWWWTRPAAGPGTRPAQAASPDDTPAATLPGLFRWRDAAGTLHITDTPPPDRPYERVERDGGRGIEVHGDR